MSEQRGTHVVAVETEADRSGKAEAAPAPERSDPGQDLSTERDGPPHQLQPDGR